MTPALQPSNDAARGVRAVLVAAGRATRMGPGAGPRKPLIELHGRSILEHTCAAFDACAEVSSIVIVCHPDDVEQVRELCQSSAAFRKVRGVRPGGAERGDSVRLGCAELGPWSLAPEPGFDLIAIHDAARPFVRSEAITRTIESARAHGAALLAIPVRDTLKRSLDGKLAEATVDRSQLWSAQTPQVFEAEGLRACQAKALEEDFQGTDDAALWERYRGPLRLVPGHWGNLKITDLADLAIGEALLHAAQGKSSTP